MGLSLEKRVEKLEAVQKAVLPTDVMSEAGRKVLLTELIRMLKVETGSRIGDDPENVHDMRVAIRRSRSAFSLLKPYFRAKDVRTYSRELHRLGSVLGDVRDLDVLIENLRAYQQTLVPEQQAALQESIDVLDAQRIEAREDLIARLDSKRYRRFVKEYSQFTSTPVEGVPLAQGVVEPIQVRHLLPGMIAERLAAVLAYEDALDIADDRMLHMLRIEFKRLRYIVSLFQDVLGSQISAFIQELKGIQDCLGELHDSMVARSQLLELLDTEVPSGVLGDYLAGLETQRDNLRTRFAEHWANFKTRKVQQKLSGAVLSLR